MRIAILGFGREGKSVFKFLKKNRRYKNAEIIVLDRNKELNIPRGAGSFLGAGYLNPPGGLGNFDVVFRSPGIPYLLPEIQKAKKTVAKISSTTKLFFENCRGTVIGITGTKGKGTTSTILYEILKAAGRKVFLVGNIGRPALETLEKTGMGTVTVFELSSFQLQDMETSPHIAAVLDVFPDHLDAHKSLAEYYAAKSNVCRFQKPGDTVFFFGGNKMSRKTASAGKGKKIAVYPEKFSLFGPGDLKIKGFHNFRNAAMAATIAAKIGVPAKTIKKSVLSFRGMEHRLELVKKIIRGGREITFYNDSASTNPDTAAAAVMSFPGTAKVLIAGGQDKKLDYAPLAKALKKSGTRSVVLFGENKAKIATAIKKSGAKTAIAANMAAAVKAALAAAVKTGKDTTVIFSPAATSFDMFDDYADRGRKFKKTVKALQ